MTFQDIFKSSFLESINSISLLDMALALLLAFAIGMFIFLIYKKTFAGVMYSSSFGVTLVALSMITTLVMLAVTSNANPIEERLAQPALAVPCRHLRAARKWQPVA